MLTIDIFVWRKNRDRDHTALRAIPICPPNQNCVGRSKATPGGNHQVDSSKILQHKYMNGKGHNTARRTGDVEGAAHADRWWVGEA